MKRHLIYCGLQAPDMSIEQADQLVRDLAIAHLPNGHTIHEATGRWAGYFGPVDEPTLIVEAWEMIGFDKPNLVGIIADYKELAKQEAVVMLTIPCEAVVF